MGVGGFRVWGLGFRGSGLGGGGGCLNQSCVVGLTNPKWDHNVASGPRRVALRCSPKMVISKNVGYRV